jgi:hypothetical protein
MGKVVATAVVMGFIGLAFALVGKHVFGVNHSWLSFNPTINVNVPQRELDPAKDDARKAIEDRRRHEEQLAAIKRREEQARLEVEANRRAAEAARAAEEAEATRRRIRQADEAERAARAERIQAWRRANGGCDPPLRRQCMYANGQQIGCTCTR